MSRVTGRIGVVVATAAAGFFLAALESGAAAHAETTIPVNPGLPALFERVVASSAGIPQQLLQSTSSTLGRSALAPTASPGQAPLVTATLNMPQNLSPNTGRAAGPTMAGLPTLPGELSSMLPFPMPNLRGTTTVAAPIGAAGPTLIPGLP